MKKTLYSLLGKVTWKFGKRYARKQLHSTGAKGRDGGAATSRGGAETHRSGDAP